MIKRYYQGLVSLYYSMPMTMLAVLVFAAAFADIRKPEWNLKPLMSVLAVLLALSAFPELAASISRFRFPLKWPRKPGVSIITPVEGAKSQSLPIRFPFTVTLPFVGRVKPQMQRISVVFPQPFGPTSP